MLSPSRRPNPIPAIPLHDVRTPHLHEHRPRRKHLKLNSDADACNEIYLKENQSKSAATHGASFHGAGSPAERVNTSSTTASAHMAPNARSLVMNGSFILMRELDEVRDLVVLQVVFVLVILQHKFWQFSY